jgi:hypothetical protein
MVITETPTGAAVFHAAENPLLVQTESGFSTGFY